MRTPQSNARLQSMSVISLETSRRPAEILRLSGCLRVPRKTARDAPPGTPHGDTFLMSQKFGASPGLSDRRPIRSTICPKRGTVSLLRLSSACKSTLRTAAKRQNKSEVTESEWRICELVKKTYFPKDDSRTLRNVLAL